MAALRIAAFLRLPIRHIPHASRAIGLHALSRTPAYEGFWLDENPHDFQPRLSTDILVVLCGREPLIVCCCKVVAIGHHFTDARIVFALVPWQADYPLCFRHAKSFVREGIEPSSPMQDQGFDAVLEHQLKR